GEVGLCVHADTPARESGEEEVAGAIQQYGSEDDRAGDQRIKVRIDVEDVESVLDALDQDCTEHRSGEDLASPAKDTRPAQDSGGDGIDLIVQSEPGRHRPQLGQGNDPAQSGAETADEIDNEYDLSGLNPRFAGILNVVAHRINLSPERQSRQREVSEAHD